MNENMLLGILIILFLIFVFVHRFTSGKPIQRITMEAAMGSLLAGTFFGVVREVLLKRPANNRITLTVILMFFLWYICTKGFSQLFISGSFMNVQGSESSGNERIIDPKNEKISKEAEKKLSAVKKLPEIYQVFLAAIITMLVIILLVSFYAQRNEGSDKHIVNYNIMITCMVILAGFFTFLSRKKLNYEIKIRIMSFTIAFALVFGIFAPVFIFKSFSFASLIITTLIFFVWLTLTFSFSNFASEKTEYINRY